MVLSFGKWSLGASSFTRFYPILHDFYPISEEVRGPQLHRGSQCNPKSDLLVYPMFTRFLPDLYPISRGSSLVSGKWSQVRSMLRESGPDNGPSDPVLVFGDRRLPDSVIRPSALSSGTLALQISSSDLVLVFGDPPPPGFLHQT